MNHFVIIRPSTSFTQIKWPLFLCFTLQFSHDSVISCQQLRQPVSCPCCSVHQWFLSGHSKLLYCLTFPLFQLQIGLLSPQIQLTDLYIGLTNNKCSLHRMKLKAKNKSRCSELFTVQSVSLTRLTKSNSHTCSSIFVWLRFGWTNIKCAMLYIIWHIYQKAWLSLNWGAQGKNMYLAAFRAVIQMGTNCKQPEFLSLKLIASMEELSLMPLKLQWPELLRTLLVYPNTQCAHSFTGHYWIQCSKILGLPDM